MLPPFLICYKLLIIPILLQHREFFVLLELGIHPTWMGGFKLMDVEIVLQAVMLAILTIF